MTRNKILRITRELLLAAVLAIACMTNWGLALAVDPFHSPLLPQQATATLETASISNLLVNGDMDDSRFPFYWRPTNHYVVGMWYEWFWPKPHRIPEYVDGGIPYHNVCYPPPPPGETCESMGNHSQGYILWSEKTFLAGIYQAADVTPCLPYEFAAYTRTDGSLYISKVGISPIGEVLPPFDPSEWDDYPDNCPPDYHSECPNPGVDGPEDLPTSIIWSPAVNAPAFTWTRLSITTEALSDTLSVWTYTESSTESVSQSAYWDAATLLPASFTNNRLPAPLSWPPSGFITNVVTRTVLDHLVIEWDTPEPASGQVWYEFTVPITPSTPVTPTLTHRVYLPLVIAPLNLEYATAVDTRYTTHHSVSIIGVANGDIVDFIALSRRLLGNTCVTEVSEPLRVTISGVPSTIYRTYLPTVMR